MNSFKKRGVSMAAALTFAGITPPVSAEEIRPTAWPTTVVKLEVLRPLTDFELHVPGLVTTGRVTGPVVLRVHITTEGTVSRLALLESCGNADLDEASIHAMRVMRFKPYTFGDVPIEVTLLAPIHIPSRWGKSPR